MELTVIGSGTAAPSPKRTGPAFWITSGKVKLMLDCGAGTLHRCETLQIPWSEVTHIALSHFHVDHWGELPSLLFALKSGIVPPRSHPLRLLAPSGIRGRMSALAKAYGDWLVDSDYPLRIEVMSPGCNHTLATGIAIEAFRTPHTKHSLAFAIRDKNTRLVYTGDTGPPDNTFVDWASGCDLLLAECSRPVDEAVDGHMTPASVGELANAVGTKMLVLTHLYPRFGEANTVELVQQTFDGVVCVAMDGDLYRVGDIGRVRD